MIRLIFAETNKVWKNKFFLLTLLSLVLINLFLLWFSISQKPGTVSPSAYQVLNSKISGMDMDELAAFIKNETELVESFIHIDTVLRNEAMTGKQDTEGRNKYASEFASYYEMYRNGEYLKYTDTLASEYNFLHAIFLEYSQVSGYEEFLNAIEQNANKLSSVSIFSNTNNDYNSLNIHQTAEAFKGMHGTHIQYYPQKGLFTALDFALTDTIAVFGMLLVATVLVRYERDAGLLRLIRCNPAGRLKTATAKLLVLACSLAIVVFLLYAVNLLYCRQLYGLGPLDRTIQSVPFLMRSTWKLTVGQYLFLFFLTKWAAATVCGTWVMLAMLMAPRMLSGIAASLALIGVNLLIRTLITATSQWNVLKYANLVSLLRTNELLGGYRNLYWFGKPIPLLFVEVVAAISLGVVFVTLFCNRFSRQHFEEKSFTRVRILKRKHLPTFTSPIKQEWYKLLIIHGALFVIVLFGGFQIYSVFSTESIIPPSEIYYRHYIKQVEGRWTEKSRTLMSEANEEFTPIYNLNAQLASGVITQNEYMSQMQAYSSLSDKLTAFQRVLYKAQSLDERPRTQMVYESGWLYLFDEQDKNDLTDTLLMSIVIAICFSGMFSMEYQTGMVKVIGATPLGRKHTVQCKLRVTILACGILTFLSLAPRLIVSIRDYGLLAWDAPLYSITEYAAAPEIPLFMVFGLLVLTRFLAILGTAFSTLLLSQRIKNTFGTLLVSLLIFSLPPLLSVSGLKNAKWAGLYTLFHICDFFGTPPDILAGLLMSLLFVLLLYLVNSYLMAHFAHLSDS